MVLYPTFTLMLVIVAMTTVSVKAIIPLTHFLKLPAHKDHQYQFDVRSEASLVDLKAAMSNFTLDHSFKVLGEKRYIFLFRSNDTAALRHLRLPAGSAVKQYPVELGEEYFEMFDVNPGHWDFPENTKTHPILIFSEWTINLPKSLCPSTYEMEMKTWVEDFKGVTGKVRPMFYAAIANYPPKIFIFMEMEDNALQNAARLTVPIFGGVGTTSLQQKRIISV